MKIFSAKIDTHGKSLERRNPKATPKRGNPRTAKSEPFGGLGSSVDPKMLNQIKNLCRVCGQYRSCDEGCEGGKLPAKHVHVDRLIKQ